MNKSLYIASLKKNQNQYTSLLSSLKEGGYAPIEFNGDINDNDLYVLDLTDSSLEELLASFEWLKNEHNRSKTLHLRVLPLLTYSSNNEDPFDKWNNGPNEVYEELFSEEFKPFAYDIDNKEFSNKELGRVLNLYYTR